MKQVVFPWCQQFVKCAYVPYTCTCRTYAQNGDVAKPESVPTHRLYPLALVSMIAAVVVEVHDPLGLIQQMFVFILTVLIGLFCHAVFVLPAIYLIVVRRNPYRHLLRCGKALVTAFVTNNRYHYSSKYGAPLYSR